MKPPSVVFVFLILVVSLTQQFHLQQKLITTYSQLCHLQYWILLLLLYIQIVASKHRNIRIVMCTPKILSCTKEKKGERGYNCTKGDRQICIRTVSAIQCTKKKGHNRSRTHNLTHGRRRSKQSAIDVARDDKTLIQQKKFSLAKVLTSQELRIQLSQLQYFSI